MVFNGKHTVYHILAITHSWAVDVSLVSISWLVFLLFLPNSNYLLKSQCNSCPMRHLVLSQEESFYSMARLREVRWELASIWTCGKTEDGIFTTSGCGVLISLLCVTRELLAEKFAHKVIRHWETPWKMVDTNRELTQENSSAQIMWEPLGKQILFSCLGN